MHFENWKKNSYKIYKYHIYKQHIILTLMMVMKLTTSSSKKWANLKDKNKNKLNAN